MHPTAAFLLARTIDQELQRAMKHRHMVTPEPVQEAMPVRSWAAIRLFPRYQPAKG
jgi:hypothetical protein